MPATRGQTGCRAKTQSRRATTRRSRRPRRCCGGQCATTWRTPRSTSRPDCVMMNPLITNEVLAGGTTSKNSAVHKALDRTPPFRGYRMDKDKTTVEMDMMSMQMCVPLLPPRDEPQTDRWSAATASTTPPSRRTRGHDVDASCMSTWRQTRRRRLAPLLHAGGARRVRTAGERGGVGGGRFLSVSRRRLNMAGVSAHFVSCSCAQLADGSLPLGTRGTDTCWKVRSTAVISEDTMTIDTMCTAYLGPKHRNAPTDSPRQLTTS